MAADAKLVEDAFEQWFTVLSSLEAPQPASTDELPVPPSGSAEEKPRSDGVATAKGSDAPPVGAGDRTLDLEQKASGGIDKSTLALPAPRRYRDRDHLRHVAKQACLICGRKPSDAHHLRHLQPRALGRKSSDEFVVPLCRIHHRLVHRVGNEAAWWQDAGINPVSTAQSLWKQSRCKGEPISPTQPCGDPPERRVSSPSAAASGHDDHGRGNAPSA
ncbi:MAG: hypothetical protein ACJ8F3_11270 [Xanthobacteraceae bacterium]